MIFIGVRFCLASFLLFLSLPACAYSMPVPKWCSGFLQKCGWGSKPVLKVEKENPRERPYFPVPQELLGALDGPLPGTKFVTISIQYDHLKSKELWDELKKNGFVLVKLHSLTNSAYGYLPVEFFHTIRTLPGVKYVFASR